MTQVSAQRLHSATQARLDLERVRRARIPLFWSVDFSLRDYEPQPGRFKAPVRASNLEVARSAQAHSPRDSKRR